MAALDPNTVLTVIGELLPVVAEGAEAIIPKIKAMIQQASSSTEATPEQVTALADMDKQSDAALAAAIAAYDAQNPAPSGGAA